MSDGPSSTAPLDLAMAAANEMRFAEAATLLRQSHGAKQIGPAHAYLADILQRGADLENVARLGPFRLNTLVHSGWLNSVIQGRPVNAHGEPVPWFTYPAIDFLEPRISPEWDVLEWGTGNSTLWWARRARRVIGIEHDPAWHAEMAAMAPPNVRLHLRQQEQSYADLDGVEAAARFDAIVIDGQWRNRCAATALNRIKPGGLIVFENSDRPSLREGLAMLVAAGWKRIDFFGLLPSYCYRTCTTVFFQDPAILSQGPLPCDTSTSLGPTMSQVMGE